MKDDEEIIDVTDGDGGDVVVPPSLMDGHDLSKQDVNAILDELDLMANELAKHWPEGVSAQDAIDDVRVSVQVMGKRLE